MGSHLGGSVLHAEGEGDPFVTQHLGEHHGGDAHGEDGFVETVHVEDGLLDIGTDSHGWTVEGEGGEVACSTHAAGKSQGVEIVGTELIERLDVAAGDAGRLGEEVALLGGLAAVEVAHHAVVAFGSEALIVPVPTVDGQKEREGFLQLAAVAVATARKDDCNVHIPIMFSILSKSVILYRRVLMSCTSLPVAFCMSSCWREMKDSSCRQ